MGLPRRRSASRAGFKTAPCVGTSHRAEVAHTHATIAVCWRGCKRPCEQRPCARTGSTHHYTRDIRFTPDGSRLLLTVGSGSNDAQDMPRDPPSPDWIGRHALGAAWGPEQGRADLLSYDPDGRNEKTVATGLRNCSGLAIEPMSGRPWCAVNERDALGDNTPFDYATSVGGEAFYGWPWYYIGAHQDPRHKGEREDLKDKVTVPDVLFQAHSAPLQIVFYEGSAFPSEYQGSAFVSMHGSWNRALRTGYKVVRLLFDSSGKPTGEY